MTQKTNGVATNGHAAVQMYEPPKPKKALSPKQQIADWQRKARAAREVIHTENWSVMIRGREHIMFKGWACIAGLYNLGVDFGEIEARGEEGQRSYTATAILVERMPDGHRERVGAASAECNYTETEWSRRDDFQRRSMAQTRAAVKVMAANLRHIAELAGYEGTPAEEEMQGADQPQGRGDAPKAPARPRNKPGKPLTKAQLAALKPAIVASSWPKEKLAAFIKCPLSELWVRIQTLDKPTYQRLLKALKGEK